MKTFFKSIPGIISLVGIAILVLGISTPSYMLTADTNTIMPVLISLIVLIAALYVILSKKYSDDVQKWAFGVIGLIIGFWLPTK